MLSSPGGLSSLSILISWSRLLNIHCDTVNYFWISLILHNMTQADCGCSFEATKGIPYLTLTGVHYEICMQSMNDVTNHMVPPINSNSRLPWIFPGAPLKINGLLEISRITWQLLNSTVCSAVCLGWSQGKYLYDWPFVGGIHWWRFARGNHTAPIQYKDDT